MTRALDSAVTYGQHSIWTLQRLEPGLCTFNGMHAVSVDEPLDREAFARAVAGLVGRHEAMRTVFPADARSGLPVPRVLDRVDVPIEWHATNDDTDALLARLWADGQRPYDLDRGPLTRISVYVRPSGEQVVLLAMHHVTSDLGSARLALEELEARYRAIVTGQPDPFPPLRVQYREFAASQHEMLESPAGQRHEDYWRTQLGDGFAALAMPYDRQRPPLEVRRGDTWLFDLPASLITRLESRAREANGTLFPLLLASLATVLHRVSGSAPIMMGSYSSGRVRAELKTMVGLISNPLPVRVDLSPGQSFLELTRAVSATVRAGYRHQVYPLHLMAERLQTSHDPSRPPLIQAGLNLHPEGPWQLTDATWRHNAWLPILLRNQEGQFELMASVCLRRDGSALVGLQYQTALYNRDTIGHLAKLWTTALDDIAAHADRTVDTVRLMSAEDEHRVLVEWNRTERAYERDLGLHELVRRQSLATPDGIAVRHRDQSVTYRQLMARVDEITVPLRRMGATLGTVIGICLDPSIDQVAALVAILEVGGAYLPLDPTHPLERRRLMLTDARAAILVASRQTGADLEGVPRLDIDVLPPIDAAAPPLPPLPRAGGMDRAYVMFTSGSTGRPKGVEIHHRALVNLLMGAQELLATGPHDTWLSITTLAFDIAALEIFLPLVTGAGLAMADRDVGGSGARLAEEIQRHGATAVQGTPTSWRLLLASQAGPPRRMNRICGGEAMSRALADQLLEQPGTAWNLYGPVETTIWSTGAVVTPGERPPAIGRPLPNQQVYVLDEHMRPVAPGVPGQLWIGGDGVALGYIHRPDLTAERFIADPFRAEPGARLYRTGDLVRWNPSGDLEFLGRTDFQVKVRGIRIELGEIEAVLTEQPEVAETVVVARRDSCHEPRLDAYVVAAPGASIDIAALRQRLRERLTDYMVPASYTVIPAMPLTPSRKIDRTALPDPTHERLMAAPYTPPRTPTEETLTAILAEVLELDRVGIDDDFFDLGGASIASLQLSMRAEAFGLIFPAEAIFQERTVRALAERLAVRASTDAAIGPRPVEGVS